MSTSGPVAVTNGLMTAGAPVRRRIRAFFAPIDRTQTGTAGLVPFDVTTVQAGVPLAMPAGWTEAPGCRSVERRGTGTMAEVRSGSPAATVMRVRTGVGVELDVEFSNWGKLETALACGGQQMNVLAKTSAGVSVTTPLVVNGGTSSSATVLQVGAGASLVVGDVVVVDTDYAGQTGYVGAGAAGAYVSEAQAALATMKTDVDYVRRVSLNVGVIASVTGSALTLAGPLLAGVPSAGMQVSQVLGFADREGGGFLPEWSAVFCVEGMQGERLFSYYPRLLCVGGLPEKEDALGGGLLRRMLMARFCAVAVPDAEDGTPVVCVRSYVPAAGRLV